MKNSFLYSTAVALAIGLSPASYAQQDTSSTGSVTLLGEWDGFYPGGVTTQGDYNLTIGSNTYTNNITPDGVLHVPHGYIQNRPKVDLSSIPDLTMQTGISISLQVANVRRYNNNYANRIIFSLKTENNENAFALDANPTNDNPLFAFDGSNSKATRDPNVRINVSNPITPVVLTVTVQWDATNNNVGFQLYENGELKLTSTSTGNGNYESLAQQQITGLTLGGWSSSSFTGPAAEDVYRLNISSGAMTPEEIMELYIRWTTPQEDGGAPGPDMHEPAAAFHAASLTALGSAQHDGMTNQLNALRNRLVSMTAMPNTMAMPVQAAVTYSLWVEATGGYAELRHNGSDAAGYDMSSYGGILGGNVTLTNNLNVGAALAADYGKVRSRLQAEPGTGHSESSTGHLDAYYLNLFARYQHAAWAHLLVLTGALQQADMDRTVQVAPHNYTASGSTHGYGLAAMYELTYDIAVDESHANILQPLLNLSVVKTHLNGYAETAGDPQFSLNVGDIDRTTYTAAAGARWLKQWQSSVIGRPIVTEVRATVSQDFGDDRSTVTSSLANDNLISFTQHGAKAGRTAGQIGLGVTLPSHAHGSVFANVNAEWRAHSHNVTGAIGYRYDF